MLNPEHRFGSDARDLHRDRGNPRRAQLQAARRRADPRPGRLGLGRRRQALPRLPVGLLRGEPGPLPPEDPCGDGRAGEEADAHLARLSQRPARPLLQGACELTHSHMILPMNSGAEAVESALKAVRKWGYKVKGVPGGSRRDHRLREQLPRPHARDRRLQHRPGCRDGFGPFTPGFGSCRSATARRWPRAITPNTVAFLVEPIQGEAGVIIPPPGYFADVRELCTRAQRHADHRRDPDRPRPHGQAARRGARRHRGRPDADRQGALGRLLPGLGGALEQGSARRTPTRTARQHVRRQSARLRGRPHRAQGARRGRT